MTQTPRHARHGATRRGQVAAMIITWLLLVVACGGSSDEVLGASAGSGAVPATSANTDEVPAASAPRAERTGLEVGTVDSLFDLTTVGASDGITQDQSTTGLAFTGGFCSEPELELTVSNALSSELTREFEVCVAPFEALELVMTGPDGVEVFRESVARRDDRRFPTRSVSSALPFDAPFGRYELAAIAEDGSTRALTFQLGPVEFPQLLPIRIDGEPYLVLAGFDPGVVELSVYQATGNGDFEFREIEVFATFEFQVEANVSLLPITIPDRPLCITPTQNLEALAKSLDACFG